VEGRAVAAEDVRTALSIGARAECALGLVYATDARGSEAVEVLGRFPAGSHAPIVYPFAVLRGARAGSASWLAWLRDDPQARAIFASHGVSLLPH
jgi:molybdate transport system substrate-binding protein